MFSNVSSEANGISRRITASPAFLHRAVKIACALALRGQATISWHGGMNILCHGAMTPKMLISLFRKKLNNSHRKCMKWQ
jgi:hypothetical protein